MLLSPKILESKLLVNGLTDTVEYINGVLVKETLIGNKHHIILITEVYSNLIVRKGEQFWLRLFSKTHLDLVPLLISVIFESSWNILNECKLQLSRHQLNRLAFELIKLGREVPSQFLPNSIEEWKALNIQACDITSLNLQSNVTSITSYKSSIKLLLAKEFPTELTTVIAETLASENNLDEKDSIFLPKKELYRYAVNFASKSGDPAAWDRVTNLYEQHQFQEHFIKLKDLKYLRQDSKLYQAFLNEKYTDIVDFDPSTDRDLYKDFFRQALKTNFISTWLSYQTWNSKLLLLVASLAIEEKVDLPTWLFDVELDTNGHSLELLAASPEYHSLIINACFGANSSNNFLFKCLKIPAIEIILANAVPTVNENILRNIALNGNFSLEYSQGYLMLALGEKFNIDYATLFWFNYERFIRTCPLLLDPLNLSKCTKQPASLNILLDVLIYNRQDHIANILPIILHNQSRENLYEALCLSTLENVPEDIISLISSKITLTAEEKLHLRELQSL